jgi:hypothetical protein
MSNQPYRFSKGNAAGSLAQSISGFIAGGLKQRGGVHEKLMDHEMRIRERGIDTVLKSEAKKSEIKTAGKQDRKFETAKAKAGTKAAKKQTKNMVKAAQTLGGSAAPGSKVSLTPGRADYTTPPAAKAAPAAKAPAAKATPKSGIRRPSSRGGTY